MTEIMLPDYDELPRAVNGGRSGWGLFGDRDAVGLLNLLTPDRVLEAVRLVRRGAVFSLNAPVDLFDPPVEPSRATMRHHLLRYADAHSTSFDDVIDNFFPQASSQWDSLGHVGYGEDLFYNGATADEVAGGRNAISAWAERGIAGRAVLLDVERAFREGGRGSLGGESTALSPDDLEWVRSSQGVEYSPGCILLLRTGFASWYKGLDERARRALPQHLTAPGIDHTEAIARYLWNSQICAIGSDTFAVEVWPPDERADAQPFGFLHQVLIGQFGMALGELWDLDTLAADCARDTVYEMLLTSAPLNLERGVGSTANALAIK